MDQSSQNLFAADPLFDNDQLKNMLRAQSTKLHTSLEIYKLGCFEICSPSQRKNLIYARFTAPFSAKGTKQSIDNKTNPWRRCEIKTCSIIAEYLDAAQSFHGTNISALCLLASSFDCAVRYSIVQKQRNLHTLKGSDAFSYSSKLLRIDVSVESAFTLLGGGHCISRSSTIHPHDSGKPNSGPSAKRTSQSAADSSTGASPMSTKISSVSHAHNEGPTPTIDPVTGLPHSSSLVSASASIQGSIPGQVSGKSSMTGSLSPTKSLASMGTVAEVIAACTKGPHSDSLPVKESSFLAFQTDLDPRRGSSASKKRLDSSTKDSWQLAQILKNPHKGEEVQSAKEQAVRLVGLFDRIQSPSKEIYQELIPLAGIQQADVVSILVQSMLRRLTLEVGTHFPLDAMMLLVRSLASASIVNIDQESMIDLEVSISKYLAVFEESAERKSTNNMLLCWFCDLVILYCHTKQQLSEELQKSWESSLKKLLEKQNDLKTAVALCYAAEHLKQKHIKLETWPKESLNIEQTPVGALSLHKVVFFQALDKFSETEDFFRKRFDHLNPSEVWFQEIKRSLFFLYTLQFVKFERYVLQECKRRSTVLFSALILQHLSEFVEIYENEHLNANISYFMFVMASRPQVWSSDLRFRELCVQTILEYREHPNPAISVPFTKVSNNLEVAAQQDSHIGSFLKSFAILGYTKKPHATQMSLPTSFPLYQLLQRLTPLDDFQCNFVDTVRRKNAYLAIPTLRSKIPVIGLSSLTDTCMPIALSDFLESREKAMLIYGYYGSGRTALASEMFNESLRAWQPGAYFPIFVNSEKILHPSQFSRADFLGNHFARFEHVVKASSLPSMDVLLGGRYLFIFDDADGSFVKTKWAPFLSQEQGIEAKYILLTSSLVGTRDYLKSLHTISLPKDSSFSSRYTYLLPQSGHNQLKNNRVQSQEQTAQFSKVFADITDRFASPFHRLDEVSFSMLHQVAQTPDIQDILTQTRWPSVVYRNTIFEKFKKVCFQQISEPRLESAQTTIAPSSSAATKDHYSNLMNDMLQMIAFALHLHNTHYFRFRVSDRKSDCIRLVNFSNEDVAIDDDMITMDSIHCPILEICSDAHTISLLTQNALVTQSMQGTFQFGHLLYEQHYTVDCVYTLLLLGTKGMAQAVLSVFEDYQPVSRYWKRSKDRLADHLLGLSYAQSHLQLFAERAHADIKFQALLFDTIIQSRDNPDMEVPASNAITILNYSGFGFQEKDLRRIRIPYADLAGCNLHRTDLSGAHLRQVCLERACIQETNFYGANVEGARFGSVISPVVHEVDCNTLCAFQNNFGVWCVASASHQGPIIIWDLETGEEISSLQGHAGGTTVLESYIGHNDQNLVLSAGKDAVIRSWDVASSSCMDSFCAHTDSVTCIAIDRSCSPPTHFYSGSLDGTIRVWDIEEKSLIATFDAHRAGVSRLCCFTVEKGPVIAVSVGFDNHLRVWRMDTFAMLVSDPLSSPCLQLDALFCGEGKPVVMVCLEDGRILQREIPTGYQACVWQNPSKSYRPTAFYSGLALQHPIAVQQSDQQELCFWSVSNGQILLHLKTTQARINAYHRATKDGRTCLLLAAKQDGSVQIWNPFEDHILSAIDNPLPMFTCMTILATEKSECLVVASASGQLGFFDSETGWLLRIAYKENEDFTCVSSGRLGDDIFVLVGTRSGKIFSFDVLKLTWTLLYDDPHSGVLFVHPCFMTNGQDITLVVVNCAGDVRFIPWREFQASDQEGKFIHGRLSHQGQIAMPDGQNEVVDKEESVVVAVCKSKASESAGENLVVCFASGKVELWDCVEQRMTTSIDVEKSDITTAAFCSGAPSDCILLLGTARGTIQSWNVDKQEMGKEVKVSQISIRCMDATFGVGKDDERVVVIADVEGGVFIWSLNNSKLLCGFEGKHRREQGMVESMIPLLGPVYGRQGIIGTAVVTRHQIFVHRVKVEPAGDLFENVDEVLVDVTLRLLDTGNDLERSRREGRKERERGRIPESISFASITQEQNVEGKEGVVAGEVARGIPKRLEWRQSLKWRYGHKDLDALDSNLGEAQHLQKTNSIRLVQDGAIVGSSQLMKHCRREFDRIGRWRDRQVDRKKTLLYPLERSHSRAYIGQQLVLCLLIEDGYIEDGRGSGSGVDSASLGVEAAAEAALLYAEGDYIQGNKRMESRDGNRLDPREGVKHKDVHSRGGIEGRDIVEEAPRGNMDAKGVESGDKLGDPITVGRQGSKSISSSIWEGMSTALQCEDAMVFRWIVRAVQLGSESACRFMVAALDSGLWNDYAGYVFASDFYFKGKGKQLGRLSASVLGRWGALDDEKGVVELDFDPFIAMDIQDAIARNIALAVGGKVADSKKDRVGDNSNLVDSVEIVDDGLHQERNHLSTAHMEHNENEVSTEKQSNTRQALNEGSKGSKKQNLDCQGMVDDKDRNRANARQRLKNMQRVKAEAESAFAEQEGQGLGTAGEPDLERSASLLQQGMRHGSTLAIEIGMYLAQNAQFGAFQRIVGSMLLAGELNVSNSQDLGLQLLTLAAEQDDAEARFQLGSQSLPETAGGELEALSYLILAAEQGHTGAQWTLAGLYLRGERGVGRSVSDALEWYARAAEQQHAPALKAIGDLWAEGANGGERSATEALRWYRLAAHRHLPSALHAIGTLYYTGDNLPITDRSRREENGGGDLQRADVAQAFRWCLLAARHRYAAAQYSVANMLYSGEGVCQDMHRATLWYRRAADQKHADAMCALGAICAARAKEATQESSKTSTEGNHDPCNPTAIDATSWGNGDCAPGDCMHDCLNLCDCLCDCPWRWAWEPSTSLSKAKIQPADSNQVERQKIVATLRDFQYAVEWYQRAAVAGCAYGDTALGNMLQLGEGVAQDDVAAASHFRRAADGGDPDGLAAYARCLELGIGTRIDLSTARQYYQEAAMLGLPDALAAIDRLGKHSVASSVDLSASRASTRFA